MFYFNWKNGSQASWKNCHPGPKQHFICYLLISLSWKPLIYRPVSKLTNVEARGFFCAFEGEKGMIWSGTDDEVMNGTMEMQRQISYC